MAYTRKMAQQNRLMLEVALASFRKFGSLDHTSEVAAVMAHEFSGIPEKRRKSAISKAMRQLRAEARK